MTLFEDAKAKSPPPLAERVRPTTVENVVGQDHLIGAGKPLARMMENKRVQSLIFWGPPGCGKTTLARLIAQHVDQHFVALSAILSGVGELRKIFERAEIHLKQTGQNTLLFVDEIHHFNRSQQDCFLKHLEEGVITLIGATTENPSFELNRALLSRVQVFTLNRLQQEDLQKLYAQTEKTLGNPLPLNEEAKDQLIRMSDGDGRILLNGLDAVLQANPPTPLDETGLMAVIQQQRLAYDKSRDEHYNLISALHKSMRGSDADAALYWLSRMLAGGENPLYILRRLVRFASEDIGLADPQALPQAIAAQQAYHFLGSPEGDLALVQCVLYLSTAPKSNSAYMASKAALKAAKQNGSLNPPKHILNAPTAFMKQEGYGKGYQYDPETKDNFSGQNYFPEQMEREQYYSPQPLGFEREVCKRLAYWQKLRDKKMATA